MPASREAIKALREKTSASISDCRTALDASGGDEAKAIAWLRKRGKEIAEHRRGRATAQGRVESYVHHDGRLAAMVEVNCETDFVARTPEFIAFCRDVAMQVAAMSPQYVQPEEAPEAVRGDPEALKAAYLLTQPFVRDQGTTVGDLLNALIGKTGERVVIRRFVRFGIGEAPSG